MSVIKELEKKIDEAFERLEYAHENINKIIEYMNDVSLNYNYMTKEDAIKHLRKIHKDLYKIREDDQKLRRKLEAEVLIKKKKWLGIE
jgi:chromosome segregation ATPase